MEVDSTAWISIDFGVSVMLRELFEPGGLEKFQQRAHEELERSFDPLRMLLKPLRPGSRPAEKHLKPSIPLPKIDGLWSSRIHSLTGLGLIVAVERLCAGEPVLTISQWLRDHNCLGGYEQSSDWDLHGDLLGLQMRVQERVTANLDKIREKVLSDLSPATKKRHEACSGSAPGSLPVEQEIKHVSSRRILQFMIDCLIDRSEVWTAIECDSGLLLRPGFTSDWSWLAHRIAKYLGLVECQEDWVRFVGSQRCEAGLADERRKARDLDVIIDECLEFGEGRAIVGRVLGEILDKLSEHQAADKAIGVPSTATARDLDALITLAEDLRKLELNFDVWGLKNLGREVPPGAWSALLAGDRELVWPRSRFGA